MNNTAPPFETGKIKKCARAFLYGFLGPFVVLFVLCWTPLAVAPIVVFTFLQVQEVPIVFGILFLLGMPFGGYVFVVLRCLWRDDFSQFWYSVSGLTGMWIGIIAGSLLGVTFSGVIE